MTNPTFNTINLAALASDFTVASIGNTTSIINPTIKAGFRIDWNDDGTIKSAFRSVAGDSCTVGLRMVNGAVTQISNDELSLIVVGWILDAKNDFATVTDPAFDGGA
jgi:hypothetical protein